MSTDTVKSESVTAPDAVTTKLPQTVEIKDVGPCKKHVKVTVDREAIATRYDEKVSELVLADTSHMDGFRPGKAPRKMIEKKYKKDIYADMKTEVLMASLEQLAEEQQISPLSPPELDPKAIAIPEEGPFIYEFDIEVRPEFDIPPYKGLKIKRPTHAHTAADVKKEMKAFLEPYGQIIPKPGQDGAEPTVALDDLITTDLVIRFEGKELNTVKESRIKVEKTLALADGVANDFGKIMAGAKVGDARTVHIALSQDIGNPALKGKTVEAIVKVLDIKVVQSPELTAGLMGYFGVRTEEQFEELMRVRLERKLEYAQRQSARTQILGLLAGDAKWDLPQDLLQRQARKTLQRRVMEMKNAGMTGPGCCRTTPSAAPRTPSKSTSSCKRSPKWKNWKSKTVTSIRRSRKSPSAAARRPARCGPAWRKKTSLRRSPRNCSNARPWTWCSRKPPTTTTK
jgi:trigger factor